MRRIGLMILILFIVIVLIPFLLVGSCDAIKDEKKPQIIQEKKVERELVYVNVLDTANDKAMKLELDEYIKGVVAAEMPVNFHLEALKAQAIAARTYTLNRLEKFGGKPDDVHSQYDLCTDSRHCQAWISKEDRLSAWAKNAELSAINNIELWRKIEDAVNSTKGQVLLYNGTLIDPLFFSASGGSTENSEDYFPSSVPYLRSVSSEYEESSPYNKTNFDIGVKEFSDTIKKKYPDIKLESSKMIDNIEILSHTAGGKVEKVRVGNKVLKGRELRELLGLRSSEFAVEQNGMKLAFTVVGYGHGVGLSQYGADGMAKAGYTYEEILKHYFTGTELKSMY